MRNLTACRCDKTRWKGRSAFRLSNGAIEVVVLLGGGHIAELRQSGSAINALWESPWETIDPQTFQPRTHTRRYGTPAVGKFLSGYTGHALSLGYFGMPSAEEERLGLPLHGEPASREWKVLHRESAREHCLLTLQVNAPAYGLKFEREIRLSRGQNTAEIHETVRNLHDSDAHIQWVQHATFGEPLLTPGESIVALSGAQAKTWPLGYEGKASLADDRNFRWPRAPKAGGGTADLSQPFRQDGTGLVASILLNGNREDGYVAGLNWKLGLIAGYCFDRAHFPWLAMWEENRAREYAPWNGITRALGVEFGTSPMPLGLDQAITAGRMFGAPALIRVPANGKRSTRYTMFVATTPSRWKKVRDVRRLENGLMIEGPRAGDELLLR